MSVFHRNDPVLSCVTLWSWIVSVSVGETLVPSEPHGVIVGTPPPCVGLPAVGTLGCEQRSVARQGSVRGNCPNEA